MEVIFRVKLVIGSLLVFTTEQVLVVGQGMVGYR